MSGLKEFLEEEFNFESEYYPGSKRKRQPVAPPPPAVEEPADWTLSETVTKAVQGVPTTFYLIGALCIGLERPPVTIRLWIRKGYIPDATYRMPKRVVGDKTYKGDRLYTRQQIEAVLEIAEAHGIRHNVRVDWSKHHPDLALEITEAWLALKS